MDQHLLFDSIPGLQHVSKSVHLSNTLEKHQDLERWDKKEKKINSQFNSKESKIDRKIGESIAFKNDKMFKTVFSKSVKKMTEKAKAVNAEVYAKWKEEHKLQLEKTNIEFKEDLKRLEEKWFKESDVNISTQQQQNTLETTDSQNETDEDEEESEHSSSHEPSTISSDYHPIEERIPEEFFSDTSSLSNSVSEDDEDRQEVYSN
jgi:hypothetical protein